MITQKVQLVQYFGEFPSGIADLSNIDNVEKIYHVDDNGNYIGWLSNAPYEYLQGMTHLEPSGTYLVYSKPGVAFPYNLFVNPIDARIIANSGNIETIFTTLNSHETLINDSYLDAQADLAAVSGYLENLNVDKFNTIEIDIIENTNRFNEVDARVTGHNISTNYQFSLVRAELADASGTLNSKIDSSISGILNAAPEALDTIGEIAEALNNNPDIGDFINTVNDATITNFNKISEVSGVLNDDIVTASGALNSRITDVSGVLQECCDTNAANLVETSGTLHQLILDSPRYEFDIVSNFSDPNLANAYRWSGVGISATNQDNPTLYLRRGETYTFNINSRFHPFYIKTSRSIGTGDMYNQGVSNNGYSDRTIVFEVPYDAPAILYYQCSNHAAMGGTLYTVQPTIIDFLIDGGTPGSFDDAVATTTTTAGPFSGDTTYTVPEGSNYIGQPGGGLTLSGQVGDSINFNIVEPIANPETTVTLVLYVNNVQTASVTVTNEYRLGGDRFKVTLGGTDYTVEFSAGTLSGSFYRIDL
jgi:hypothetical protein